MSAVGSIGRAAAILFKLGAAAIGVIALLIAVGYLTNEYAYLGSVTSFGIHDIIMIAAILGVALSGTALLASLPTSFKTSFRRVGIVVQPEPTYGFGAMLAVGLGATLGSPLFILIPLNIVQFEFVSLGSLVLATVLSILMAKVYQDMYIESANLGLEAVGGPSFTKTAAGVHSVRYFISRLSMWIANTALAAYSKIVFVVFDFELMPGILANYGISGFESQVIVYSVTGAFIAWTVLNALFEQRFLKLIGQIQIVLTITMVVILIYQSILLGSKGSWDFAGLLHLTSGGNWPLALVVNTGYLYLLFFGFQEIQALERDALDYSSIPIVSWIKRGYKMAKYQYLGAAMIGSVVIAAAINIFYGLAAYSVHPNFSALLKSQIPALYLANTYLGSGQELLTGAVFLIATITTFVPSFLAASRHLSALAEDGFMPLSVSKLSYVFTLGAILILALGNQDFLVSITDFLVLISLAIISLSAIWLRKRGVFSMKRNDALPLLVGVSCFVAGGAIYQISPSVAIFGSISIAVSYLIYDVYELGSLGSQLFLGVFDGVAYLALWLYPHTFGVQGFFLFDWLHISTGNSNMLSYFLGLSTLLLFVNLAVDLYLRKQTRSNTRLERERATFTIKE